MTVYEALSLVIQFGTLLITLISLFFQRK
ncbi:putative holin-like toxin [Ligilactobacillus hayakitensis]